MIWAKRRIKLADYTPAYLERLGKLQAENPSLQFMMVSTITDRRNEHDYYIGVPSQAFLSGFDGFVTVDEKDLPKEVDEVLVANQDDFARRFRLRMR
jgi:hypothetical protein